MTVGQRDKDDWACVDLSGSYDSPTVIAKSLSYNGNHPTHVRLRNVGSDRFDAALEEWDYKDGRHAQETLGYAVLESGTHSLDGVNAEAGRVMTDHTFRSVGFDQNFFSTPVIFSQAQSYRGPHRS